MVDGHARGERVLRRDQPVGQSELVLRVPRDPKMAGIPGFTSCRGERKSPRSRT
jgi:hypothetical protein